MQKGGFDTLLHQQSGACTADLALIEPDGIDDTFDRAIEIGILENDEGRLPAQFQCQALARASRHTADLAANLGRAGKRDLINARVLHQQPTGFAVPSNKVHHTRRKPHRVAQLGKA